MQSEAIPAKILPEKFPAVSLQGHKVRLEPYLAERDIKTLHERMNGSPFALADRSISNYDSDELIWKYLPIGPFGSASAFEQSLSHNIDTLNYTYFTVFDAKTQSQIGLIAILSNNPAFLRTEIGSIIFCPLAQRTGANTEANYLLMDYCFELGYRRLEWKTNNLNERSKSAALSLGYQFEIVQESHMITKGCNRDTAWFGILSTAWPTQKEVLKSRILN